MLDNEMKAWFTPKSWYQMLYSEALVGKDFYEAS